MDQFKKSSVTKCDTKAYSLFYLKKVETVSFEILVLTNINNRSNGVCNVWNCFIDQLVFLLLQ